MSGETRVKLLWARYFLPRGSLAIAAIAVCVVVVVVM